MAEPTPCASGSRCITPWFPNLTHAWVRPQELAGSSPPTGSTADFMEEWRDNSVSFLAHMNADAIQTWKTPDRGVPVRPMHGYWSQANNPGLQHADWDSNSRAITWAWDFMQRYFSSRTEDFSDTLEYRDGGNRRLGTTGGGGGRSLVWRPLAWYRINAQSQGNTAFSMLRDWAYMSFSRRMYSHLWRDTSSSGTPSGTYDPTGAIYPPRVNSGNREINKGTERSWDGSTQWTEDSKIQDGSWIPDLLAPNGEEGARDPVCFNTWNTWDRNHHYSNPWWAAGIAGLSIGAVQHWCDWRWTVQAYPGGNSHHMDTKRSTANILHLTLGAWLLGFEYADPGLIAEQCGGAWGSNGGAGFKPSDVLGKYVSNAIGVRFGGVDTNERDTGSWVDGSARCDTSGYIGCVTSDPTWIAQDQVNGQHVWQCNWMLFVLQQCADFYDWMLAEHSRDAFADSAPGGDGPALRTGLQNCIDYSIDIVNEQYRCWQDAEPWDPNYGATIQMDKGEFPFNAQANFYNLPPTTKADKTTDTDWGRSQTDAYSIFNDLPQPQTLTVVHQMRSVTGSGGYNLLLREGTTGAGQNMGVANFAWYYGHDHPDVVESVACDRFTGIESSGSYNGGERPNITDPYYAAQERADVKVDLAADPVELFAEAGGKNSVFPFTVIVGHTIVPVFPAVVFARANSPVVEIGPVGGGNIEVSPGAAEVDAEVFEGTVDLGVDMNTIPNQTPGASLECVASDPVVETDAGVNPASAELLLEIEGLATTHEVLDLLSGNRTPAILQVDIPGFSVVITGEENLAVLPAELDLELTGFTLQIDDNLDLSGKEAVLEALGEDGAVEVSGTGAVSPSPVAANLVASLGSVGIDVPVTVSLQAELELIASTPAVSGGVGTVGTEFVAKPKTAPRNTTDTDPSARGGTP